VGDLVNTPFGLVVTMGGVVCTSLGAGVVALFAASAIVGLGVFVDGAGDSENTGYRHFPFPFLEACPLSFAPGIDVTFGFAAAGAAACIVRFVTT
jgi:hypothetical protein